MKFGVYADEEGLAWVGGLVAEASRARGARLVGQTVVGGVVDAGSGLATAEMYDFLAQEWALEHPGRSRAPANPWNSASA
ncbi:hypothetical protein [Streptomyces sp. NPDC056160]|uniref:hypothetical protein n=1 Tax=Streptomyces sp. NPDC056160 TaxID=3345731 RepID=UPI0035E121B7